LQRQRLNRKPPAFFRLKFMGLAVMSED